MNTEKRKLGNIGEEAACLFLTKHGFKVVERNYLRKWGEIDIIAERGGALHFVEVKSANMHFYEVSPETAIRPEDNMHPQKISRLNRVIQTYLIEKNIDQDWQLDLVIVLIDKTKRSARVEMIENIS